MFDLPETKRVRRTKLYKSSSPNTPNAGLHLDFDFVTVVSTTDSQPAQPPSSEDLDFQLFSTTQKVTLKDPTPPPSEEDAWELQAQSQKRPVTYYVLTEADMAARRQELQLAQVAVSAEEIMKGAKICWPGCRVPWKVTTIEAAAATPQCKGSGKPGKPGKKRRLYLRKKEQEKREVEKVRREVEVVRLLAIEARKKYAGLPKEEKEAREKEERNKRNREKKVKRRIREKAKKEAARVAGGGVSESENESGNEKMVEE